MLFLSVRRDIPNAYAINALKEPKAVVHDRATFIVSLMLQVGLALEPLGIPVSAVAAVCSASRLQLPCVDPDLCPPRTTRAPWRVVIFSLGMYLAVCGLKSARPFANRLAEQELWSAAIGTGVVPALLSSVTNNMLSVLLGALSIQRSSTESLARRR